MGSKGGRRIKIVVYEVGCNVPTIEVPSKPEHGEFGTPIAKRPVKAIEELLTQFLNRTVQEGYLDQTDIAKFFGKYILITDFPKLQKQGGINLKHLYMNKVEQPIAPISKAMES